MRAINQLRFRRCQSGAAAIEFALIFPFLFFLIYATIVYSYLFVIQESITYAAQEAAESAVAVVPGEGDYATQASDTVRSAMSWMSDDQYNGRIQVQPSLCPQGGVVDGGGICPSDTAGYIVRVNYSTLDLFPTIGIGGLSVPPMPTQLTASAVARI